MSDNPVTQLECQKRRTEQSHKIRNVVKIFWDTFVNKEVADSGNFPALKSELVAEKSSLEYDWTFNLDLAYELAFIELSKKYSDVVNV